MNSQMPGQNFGELWRHYSDRTSDSSLRTCMQLQFISNKDGSPGLQVEMAPIAGKSVNWSEKITLNLTNSEVIGFCSVMFGLRESVEGRFHGERRNKGIVGHNNGERGVLINLSDAGRVIKHGLQGDDRLECGVFAVRRLSNIWGISSADTLAFLRQSTRIF